MAEIGAAWKKPPQDAGASSLLLEWPGPKPRDPQEPPGPSGAAFTLIWLRRNGN